MKKGTALLFVCLFMLLHAVSASASTTGDVRAGNRSYENQQYDKAVEEYSKAKDGDTDSDILSFNTGTALYKQEKYEEAVDAFTGSLITEDRGLEAMANYNIANSKFRLGSLKIEEDLSKAIQMYRQALDHYKRAIDLDEENDDARYNHELVEKKMKVLMDRQKNQPEQEKQEGKDGEEGEEGKDQKDSDQSDNGEQQSDNADKGHDEKDQETGGDQAEADKQEDDTRHEPDQQENEADSGERTGTEEENGEKMTPEEANMLLDAFGKDESLDTLEKRGRAQFRGVLKNW